MTEPTLSEMHKHYAEALRTIARLREESQRKTQVIDMAARCLRDLRSMRSNPVNPLYMDVNSLNMVHDTIAALEKSLLDKST